MTFSERHVIVKEFPIACDSQSGRRFLRCLTQEMTQVVRPAVVLDFSQIRRIDREALYLLLSCLEEAMKRNGDVRLAGMHRGGWTVLTSSGFERLFQHFPTSTEAVNSYSRPALSRTVLSKVPGPDQDEEAAA